ncbi:MAG: methionyl-tRNA formyltransferase [Desulfobacterales bacterium]
MRVIFAGTPDFSLPALQALLNHETIELVGVVTQPDRRAGRGMKLRPSPVKHVAIKHGVDVITPVRLRENEEALAWLIDKRADFLIVVAFGMLLPKEWLQVPQFGAVNVHASLLPRWRGAAPIERAILAGDDETGVCIMRMDEGLDTGCVYAEQRVPISQQTTVTDLRNNLSEMGAGLLVQTLQGITGKHLHCVPQDESRASYAAKLQSCERNIDWSQPAEMICRQIRAFSPKPGARSRFQGKLVKIIEGFAIDSRSAMVPGSLLQNNNFLDVACGHGSVFRVKILQVEGKTALKADLFLQGLQRRIEIGFDPQIKGESG